jgi:D-glycero-D-manno-heptose 1,7-bisphosphate phosphatase
MTKLYIVDVDGTLVSCASGKQFREHAADWQWLPNRIEKLQQLREQGAHIAIASNQAGVAFPWSKFTEAEIRAEIEAVAREIGAEYVGICYSTPNEKALPQYYNPNDNRRKPNPGMLIEAKEHFNVSLDEIVFVGDRDEDEKAAQAAGVAFQWADQFFS